MTTRRAVLAGAAVVGVGAVAAGVGINHALQEKAGPPSPLFDIAADTASLTSGIVTSARHAPFSTRQLTTPE